MWKNIPKNYVDEKYPELIPLFKNREDAHNGVSSSKKIEFVCPCCNKIYVRSICDIVHSGRVPCVTCSDGFSYPEKFMANVLSQLNIDFKYHVKEPWTQSYIYDFVFDYNNWKYIIETDGGLGHGHNEISDRTKQKTILIDKTKDDIARKNGYIMLRIDCNYNDNNRYEYIKESIYTTLSSMFDLSCVDWEKCHLSSLESKFKLVIDCYKSGTKYLDELEVSTGIKQRTIIKYLREAMNTGILDKETIMSTNPYKDLPPNVRFINEGHFNSRSRLVYCYEDAIIFDSIETVSNYYGFHKGSLLQAIKNKNGLIKGKHFNFYDNLPENFEFISQQFSSDNYPRNKHIYQYDLEKNLIAEYVNANHLRQMHPNYFYQNIWKACNCSRNTAYGFIWSFDKF